jgi:acyl-CoA thioesterase
MCIENDLFARHVGIELTEMAPGSASARLKIRKHHLNGVGLTQGGVVFTLADLVFAAASNSYGPIAVAINASISFVKASTEGAILTAEAKEVSRNRKLATYSILVSDEKKDTVATFQGMVYIKSPQKK